MTLRPSKKLRRQRLICLVIAVPTVVIVLMALRAPINRDERSANVGVDAASTRSVHVPELKITNIVQYVHIVEIQAKVDPGATVMINGEKAAVIWEDGEIKHFVGPLPDGVNDIAITVQNDEGGINSKQLSVVLP